MTYLPLPSNSKLSAKQFAIEMNLSLQSLPGYQSGMLVCADDSGYWLEINGVKDFNNGDLLALSRSLVLGK